MNYLTIAFRIIHIFAGVFWVGGALAMNFFIGPTIGATAQAGRQFAAHLMVKTRFVEVMTGAAILTILAGVILYWRDSNGLTSPWMHSGAGIGFAIGGIAGLTGVVFGAAFGSLNRKMAKIGLQIEGQPTPEQLTSIQDIQKRIAMIVPVHVGAVIIAVLFMATARYFTF